MSCSLSNICRLCMGKDLLTNLYDNDNGIPIDLKVNVCINLKMHPKDKLPALICSECKENIIKFYDFRIRCINTDLKLRNMLKASNTLKGNKNYKASASKVRRKKSVLTFKEEVNAKLIKVETNEIKIEVDIKAENNLEDYHDCDLESWQTDHDQLHKISPQAEGNTNHNQIPITYGKKTKKLLTMKGIGYQCDQCGKVIKGQGTFKRHVLAHSGIKPFTCDICPQQFTRYAHKVVHMRAHNGIKPYECDNCGMQFTKRQDLVRHLKVHSNERKYPCPNCGKFFKRTTDVTTHMRSHTGARPYSCKKCHKTYTSSAGLKKHLVTACKTILTKGWARKNNIE